MTAELLAEEDAAGAPAGASKKEEKLLRAAVPVVCNASDLSIQGKSDF
jgi:hypothetical protein